MPPKTKAAHETMVVTADEVEKEAVKMAMNDFRQDSSDSNLTGIFHSLYRQGYCIGRANPASLGEKIQEHVTKGKNAH